MKEKEVKSKKKHKMATRESSKRKTSNKGVRANGSRSKCGKKTTAVCKKRDGGAPKDGLGDEKQVEQKLESEDGVSRQVITSDDESCTNDIVPPANNLTAMDENIQKAMGVSKSEQVEQKLELEDDVSRQVITSDDESSTNDIDPPANNLTAMDENIQKGMGISKSEHGKGAAKSRKNRDGQGQIDNVVEKEVEKLIESEDVQKENGIPLDGPSSEIFGNGEDIQKIEQGLKCENGTDDHNKKSLDEIIEEGKYLGDKGDNSQDNLVNQGVKSQSENLTIDAGAKSEHITGNASGETERVSDDACGEQVTNRDDINLGHETAETGNGLGIKESDIGKQIIMSDHNEYFDAMSPNLNKEVEEGDGNGDDKRTTGNCERASLEAVQEEAEECKDVPLQRDDNRDEYCTIGNCERAPLEAVQREDEEGKHVPLQRDDNGDDNSTRGNCERAPLEAVQEEAEQGKDVPLQRDDNGDEYSTIGNCEREILEAVQQEDEEGKHVPLQCDDNGDDNSTRVNCERAPLEAVQEEAEQGKDVPLQRDDNGDDNSTTGNCERAPLEAIEEEDEEGKDIPLFSDSDVEIAIELDDKQFKNVIDSLAEGVIEDLVEQTVSNYDNIRTKDESKRMRKLMSSDIESEEDEDNMSLAKLKAINALKESLWETTPISMEEFRLRNAEELDAKQIHKMSVKAVTASSISDKDPFVRSENNVSVPSSTFHEEELDAKTIDKSVKAVTVSSSSDKTASEPTDSQVSCTPSTSDTMPSNVSCTTLTPVTVPSNSDVTDQEFTDESTGLKSDTTFTNGMESDSSDEMIVITRRRQKRKKCKK